MSRNQQSSNEIPRRVLAELEAFQGIYWQEVRSELHDERGEITIWILLNGPADLCRTHRRFRDVVSSRFYLARFSVSYVTRSPDGEIVLDFLADNDAIESAGTSRPLGISPALRRCSVSLFPMAPRAERSRRHVH